MTEIAETADLLHDLKVVADFFGVSLKEAEGMVPLLKAAFGQGDTSGIVEDDNTDAPKEQKEDDKMSNDTQEPKAVRIVQREDGKVKCKCCGFYKKPRRVLVTTGVCGVCTTALADAEDGSAVEVIGRMGKKGRNSVRIMADGKAYRVKRLSSRHSERVAARYASKGKGYAKSPKRESTEPRGIRTNSRLRDDERV